MWLSEMIKYFMLFSFLGFCIAKIAYSTNTWTVIPPTLGHSFPAFFRVVVR
jgi:hypothetical protein